MTEEEHQRALDDRVAHTYWGRRYRYHMTIPGDNPLALVEVWLLERIEGPPPTPVELTTEHVTVCMNPPWEEDRP